MRIFKSIAPASQAEEVNREPQSEDALDQKREGANFAAAKILCRSGPRSSLFWVKTYWVRTYWVKTYDVNRTDVVGICAGLPTGCAILNPEVQISAHVRCSV